MQCSNVESDRNNPSRLYPHSDIPFFPPSIFQYSSIPTFHFSSLRMKNVVLLGSTGSIGTSTIKVANDLPDRIRLIGLGAGNNVDLLLEQCREHKPRTISISNPTRP